MEINADYVRGFADADGGFNGHIVSLHNADLVLLKRMGEFLEKLGIKYRIAYKRPKGHKICGVIQITGLRNLLLYADKIGFCMERKQNTLMERINYSCRKGRPYNLDDHDLYIRLKSEGATYREMASSLGLSPSTVDRREKRGVWPLDSDLESTIRRVVYKK